MLAIILTALLCIVIPPAIIFIAAWLGERKSETFDLSPYREPQRDERTDNIVDLVERLKASRPAVFPSAQTPGEPRDFYSPDAVQPHTSRGMGLARESRDPAGVLLSHRKDEI